MCVDRAVLIAVLILVKGETISSSAKARGYKAPIEIRGSLHSDGFSWKDTPAFAQVLPGFWQTLQAQAWNLLLQLKEKTNRALFGLPIPVVISGFSIDSVRRHLAISGALLIYPEAVSGPHVWPNLVPKFLKKWKIGGTAFPQDLKLLMVFQLKKKRKKKPYKECLFQPCLQIPNC